MPVPPLTRIISDFHLGDERSWVHRLESLAPLLEGVDSLVINGDCCDTQKAGISQDPAAVRAFFTARVPQTTFITGNHDPDITATDELSLCDGRIWITHGDVLFDDIAPWSRLQPELARRLAAIRPRHSADDWNRIPTRIRMMREACLNLPPEIVGGAPGHWARFRRMLHDLFPPHRALAMLRSWTVAPGRAARLAAAQRPAARFILLGHIHFPGVWRRAGRVVINTGSFSPPLGARLVDLSGGMLRVHRIDRQGNQFIPGRELARFLIA